jgi:hypothetical protein
LTRKHLSLRKFRQDLISTCGNVLRITMFCGRTFTLGAILALFLSLSLPVNTMAQTSEAA